MFRGRVESELEEEEPKDGDGAITVVGVLGKDRLNDFERSKKKGRARRAYTGRLEAKGRAEDDGEEGAPAHS